MSAFELLHPGVKHAIWDMRWEQLNSIQAAAIPVIIQQTAHVVITAPTAGGKTEAAFLPVISMIADEAEGSIRAVYIGPLKALINDQFERLERICERCQLPVHRWHGDVSQSEKAKTRVSPSGILLITPESLEAMFARRGREVPKLFSGLRFIVIDELHAFLDNVRGIHLRSLISRIKSHAGCNPRAIGLSATIGSFEAAKVFLNPNAPSTVVVLEGPKVGRSIKLGIRGHLSAIEKKDKQDRVVSRFRLSAREWEQKLEQVPPGELSKAAPLEKQFQNGEYVTDPELVTTEVADIASDICRHFRDGTNLIFGNSKRVIELAADHCHQRALVEKWPFDPFLVHHGSLSKDERESAEEILKSGRPATAFCSSTLEMGIDIGSVKAVGQIDPPWTVASMLQRLGRSGRRAGDVSVLRLYTRDETPNEKSTVTDLLFPDLLRAVALVRLVVQKWLEPPDYDRMHLSTLIHQTLSLLRQTGGMNLRDLFDALVVRGPFRNVVQADFVSLLRGLRDLQLVEQTADGLLILGLEGEAITADRTFFAAFQSSEELSVLHADRHLGNLAAGLVPPAGENLLLGGRRWEVIEVRDTEGIVLVKPSTHSRVPYFKGDRGEIHDRVAQEMHRVLQDTDEPEWLDENAKTLLRCSRTFALRSRVVESGIVETQSGVQWLPWRGTKVMRTLELLARKDGAIPSVDQLSLTYPGWDGARLRQHWTTIADFRDAPTDLSDLMASKCFEKFDTFVQPNLLNAANARDRLDVAGARSLACNHLGRTSREESGSSER
jgi:ATP-dependent Lhr-like helicase